MIRKPLASFRAPEPREFKEFKWSLASTPEPSVVIEGIDDDRSTFFGSRANEPIVLSALDVDKLPHDLVHMLYSNVREQAVPDSLLTPDVLYPMPDGSLHALEITTRRSFSQEAVAQAISEKVDRYNKLIQDNKIAALCVIVVTPTGSHSSDSPLSRWAVAQLRAAYHFGRYIQESFYNSYGKSRWADASTDMKRMTEILTAYDRDNRFDVRTLPDPATVVHITSGSFRKEYQTFDEFISERTGMGRTTKTIAHVPMVLVEEGEFDPSEFGFDIPMSPEGRLWSAGLFSVDIRQEGSFSYLEAISEATQGEPKKIKEVKPDEFIIRIPSADLEYFAMRGVMAKKHKLTDALKGHHERQRTPFDFGASTSFIDTFINSQDAQWGSVPDEFDYTANQTDGIGPKDLGKVFRTLSRDGIVKRCRALEMIATEVAANCHRNPKDRLDRHQFIIRPLHGLKAAVLIRTTRASDLEAPTFVSLLWEGPNDFYDGVFEEAHKWAENKWYTKFFSLSREECSQLQNLSTRYLSFWAHSLELFSSRELGPHTTVDDFYSETKQAKWQLLFYIQDKQETSEVAMSLRYYYMGLLTGSHGAINEAQKVTNKWPKIIRNPLTVHMIKMLASNHSKIRLEDVLIVQSTDKVSDELSESDSAQSTILEDNFGGFLSFTGVPIKSPAQLLHFAYFGNLKNKDKMSGVAGVMKILDKSASVGMDYVRCKPGDKHSDHMSMSTDPLKIGAFCHSGPMISLGCHLLKKRLCSIHSIPDWDKFITNEVIEFALRTSLADLCSNKASTIPFESDMTVSIDDQDQDMKDMGIRKRVYAALYEMIDDLTEIKAPLNLPVFERQISTKEDGRLQVTMFKKNQIGGVREIYVLTFAARVVVRIFSDLFRRIAELHPAEKLTHESSRDTFINEHNIEAKDRMKCSYKKTVCISADMSSWAQQFTMFEFMSMCIGLLPPLFHSFCSHVLAMERDKVIQLPKDAIRAFYRSFNRASRGEETKLSSEGAEVLRNDFLGKTSNLIKKVGSPVMHLENDMMMGILHYPSTVYHLLEMETLEESLHLWSKQRGVHNVTTFEISSDDEGILVTFGCDDSKLLTLRIKQFMEEYHHIKWSLDKCYGIKSSFEKTSLSIQPIFEFNSKFNVGNTIVSPLIKFITRVCDDNPADSLHKRVSGLYTAIKTVRENGASGYLCHFLMFCQAVTLNANLGMGRMSWSTAGVFNELWAERVSYFGYYLIQNAFTAGLMGSVYANWLSAKDSQNALKLCFHLGSYSIPDDMNQLDTMFFNIATTKKYRQILKDLGLADQNIETLITYDNLESFLRESKTKDEEVLKIKKIILSPGMATSLGKKTRSDVLRHGVYMMYTAFCKTTDGSYKSLNKFKKEILDRPSIIRESEVFPMSDHFSEVHRVVTSDYYVTMKSNRSRTRVAWLGPQYHLSESQEKIKDVLRWKWFDLPCRMNSTQLSVHWAELRRMIPWLQRTLRETIEHELYPFKSAYQLLSFMDGFSKTAYPSKLILRGSIGKSMHPVIDMMKDNTSEACLFTVTELPSLPDDAFRSVDFSLLNLSMKIEDRFSAWTEILSCMSAESVSDGLLNMISEDLKMIGQKIDITKLSTRSTGNKWADDFLWRAAAMAGVATLADLFENSRNVKIYKMPQIRSKDGSYSGDTKYWRKEQNIPMFVEREGEKTTIRSPVEEHVIKALSAVSSTTIVRRGVIAPPKPLKTCGVKKFRGFIYCQFSDSGSNYYVSFPVCRPQPHHLSLSQPNSFLELWLSRNRVKGSAWADYMRLADEDPNLLTAINHCVDNYKDRVKLVRIFERSDAPPPPTSEEFDFLELADALAPRDNFNMDFDTTGMSFSEIQDKEDEMSKKRQDWLDAQVEDFEAMYGEMEFADDNDPVDKFVDQLEDTYALPQGLLASYDSVLESYKVAADRPFEMRGPLDHTLLRRFTSTDA